MEDWFVHINYIYLFMYLLKNTMDWWELEVISALEVEGSPAINWFFIY